MALPSVDQFLTGVRRSGLVEPAKHDAFLRSHPRLPGDAQSVAELMVHDGLLTAFHIKHMLNGKFSGFVLGQYHVLDRIGAGGMGVIFRAEHSTLHRQVAIKILPPAKAADAEALQRFYREARLVASLDHPNIVRAYDAAKGNGMHYLVMEYIEGMDLEKTIRQNGPLSVERASGFMAQAAAGLQHAHERGLIHRDIKPANLLIDPSGTLKILDLGLARFFSDTDDGLTGNMSAGAVIGTADYISPEQAMDSHDVDIRGDIYSLGATFYMLLTGRAPYSQSSVTQKLLAHQMREPEPLSKLRPDVPADLAGVVSKMMAKDPARRFQTPAEIVDALSIWSGLMLPESASGSLVSGGLASSGSKVRTPRPPEPPLDLEPTTTSRPRLVMLVGIGLAVVVLAGVGLSTLGNSGLPFVPTTGTTSGEESVPWSPPATQTPVPAGPSEVGRFRGHAAAIERLMLTKDRSTLLSSGYDRSVRLWTVDTRRSMRTYGGHASKVHFSAFSPDQSRIASADEAGLIVVHEIGSEKELSRIQTPKALWGVRFTADGKYLIAFGVNPVGQMWEIATGNMVRTFEGHTDVVNWLEMSADGRTIWTAGWDNRVIGWNVETGQALFNVGMTGVNRVNVLAISPDGKDLLAAGSTDGLGRGPTIFRMNPATGDVTQRWVIDNDAIYALAYSPDGKQFACSGREGRVRVYRDGRPEPTFDFRLGVKVAGYNIAWKDDKTLLICGNQPDIVEWKLP